MAARRADIRRAVLEKYKRYSRKYKDCILSQRAKCNIILGYLSTMNDSKQRMVNYYGIIRNMERGSILSGSR